MEEINKTIYFDSDAEFEDFCIAPYATMEKSKEGSIFIKGDYSEMYKQWLSEGKTFVIMDEDSDVYKNRTVRKRVPIKMDGQRVGRDTTLVQLPVRLGEWFDMPVPRKFRETLSEILSKNPETTYSQIAIELGITEEKAFEILHTWKKRN